jgi:hypothetical protein
MPHCEGWDGGGAYAFDSKPHRLLKNAGLIYVDRLEDI